MKLMVILPTYNEAENLETMVNALFALPVPNLSVLVVDDNRRMAPGRCGRPRQKHPDRVAVLHRPGKLGLGPPIQGFREAFARRPTAFCRWTATSHDPKYIPQMVERMNTATATS